MYRPRASWKRCGILEAENDPAAVAFFREVEHVPAWIDFDGLRAGAQFGMRNPIGFAVGFHAALPVTYLDANIATVMGGSGRLGDDGDFRRRFWETARGFATALDVDGMPPVDRSGSGGCESA